MEDTNPKVERFKLMRGTGGGGLAEWRAETLGPGWGGGEAKGAAPSPPAPQILQPGMYHPLPPLREKMQDFTLETWMLRDSAFLRPPNYNLFFQVVPIE